MKMFLDGTVSERDLFENVEAPYVIMGVKSMVQYMNKKSENCHIKVNKQTGYSEIKRSKILNRPKV